MKDLKEQLPEGCSALMIPNAEIREIFETTVQNWFADSAKGWNRQQLFQAVREGDSEILTREMNALVFLFTKSAVWSGKKRHNIHRFAFFPRVC